MTATKTKLTIMDLMATTKEMDNSLPFMEGREKGEMKRLTDGSTLTIHEYGYLVDSKKGNDYAVFIVTEDPQNFYFGGKVLTEGLQKLDEKGYHDLIVEEGLPVSFGNKKSASGDNYVTVKFFPESE